MEPVKLMLVDENAKTETLIDEFESWDEARERAAAYIAQQREQGRWKHVFHTVWWCDDDGGRRRLCVRPRDAEPVKF